MTTSGSVNFSLTGDEVLYLAFQALGVYGEGRQVSADDLALGRKWLNIMIKRWQKQGLHVWATAEAYLFITDNVAEYTLGNDSSYAKMAPRSDTQITKLTATASSSATSLTIYDTTGMAASDNIGIVLDSDVIHWTTISSVDSSTTLTIASGLASAAATGSHVYVFTSRVNKPLRFLSMRRVEGLDLGSTSTRSELPMEQLSHDEYFNLVNKTYNGTPNSFHYNPNINSGTLYLWPRPDDPAVYFEITYERMLEDIDSATDTLDFPVEWLDAFVFQLAVRLAPSFDKSDKLAELLPLASSLLKESLNTDVEMTSIFIQPDN